MRSDEIQLDQTCALVHAAGLHARRISEGSRAFVKQMRPCVERATRAIVGHLGESGLHKQAADLWECCYGSFAYTNAAVIAALREARDIFDLRVPDLDALKRTLIDTFHRPETGHWIRRINGDEIDETADSSVLGLIEPWGVLDLADSADRRMAIATVRFVEERLSVPRGDGRAILRFENESYMGGGPGCVNTLWLALVMLRIADHSEGDERDDLTARARAYVRTAVAMANPVGQLPELSPNLPGIGYWAAPHAWASALLIQCVRAM